MRIVGGSARGRPLRAVPGDSTRPTADRVRQSLFDALGQRCDGWRVLDLYAGTGALSFEALSRGAASAVLVEQARAAQQVIERNAQALGFTVTLVRDAVERALPRLAGPFDAVFSDPPYALRNTQATLDAVVRLLSPGGRVVLERDRREPAPVAPAGFELDERLYGDTAVIIATRMD